MTITCETPGMVSRRWRTTQSAAVRSSIGDVSPPAVMPTIMIWPMMDEIGISCGLTDGGSVSVASAKRSATICRSL